MDGVLVDNMEVHEEVFRLFCRKYGCLIDDFDWSSLAGLGNDEIIPRIMPADIVAGKGADALGREKEAMYREYYADTIRPAKGLVELLEGLKAGGIRLAVGSSGETANVDFVLDKCGIRKYFDAVISGDMVAKRKPEPDIFLLAAEKLGVRPGECVVFEDSLSGMEAARRAGMKYIALTTTVGRERILSERKPEKTIDDFTHISAEEIAGL